VTLPKSLLLRNLLRRLCRDHDPKVVFAALHASAVFEHTLSEQLARADSESKKVAAFNASYETSAKLSLAAGNEKGPLSLYHPTGDDSSDSRLHALTEFMSSMLELIPRLDKPSHGDLDDTNMIVQKLCDGLNGRDYSPTAQQRFVKVLSDTWHAHLAAGSTGPHDFTIQMHRPGHIQQSTSGTGSDSSQTYRSPTETGYEPSHPDTYHWHIICSTKSLVLTLDDEHVKSLHQRGFVVP